jgi:hypothetical protein
MQTENLPATSARMMQMITGFWTSCCIYIAAKLSIPDKLVEKPKTAAQLAHETQTHEPSLYRLLRALSSIGIFFQNDSNEFELTPYGQILRSDVPGSMRAYSIMNIEYHYSAWGNLMHSIQTGEIAFDHLHNETLWEFYKKAPQAGAVFNKAMAGLTDAVIRNILPAYDFSAFPTIVDIGGGNGALLIGIMKSTTKANGIVFDLDENIRDQAVLNISNNNLQDRCSFQAGSFFETIPAGASAYIMKSVLHDWDDANSIKILANTKKAMPDGSKLLIIENVIGEKNTPHPGNFMDINMLTLTGGRERTAGEWKTLIEKAELKFSKIIPTDSPMFSILEVEKG